MCSLGHHATLRVGTRPVEDALPTRRTMCWCITHLTLCENVVPHFFSQHNACRASRASRGTTRLSASAAVKCLSQSSESKRTPIEPRHLSAKHSQYAATDGPRAGPSKQSSKSAMSHNGIAQNRTGSSLRESSTRHRHATHRRHTIQQIH